MKTLYNESNEATYCPEDDKLRLYVGRVPREEYIMLRDKGWTSTPKQDCDFVAMWSADREDTAFSYAGYIGDEDQSPEDRAADRAERFSEYRDKRRTEAHSTADRYDARDVVAGFQNPERAEKYASRTKQIGAAACNLWSKAEYWTSRTAGVISHALYRSRPDVRMGRIKKIEADIRRLESYYTPAEPLQYDTGTPNYCPVCGEYICKEHPEAKQEVRKVWCGIARGGHWVQESLLPEIKESCTRGIDHLRLRLAYENQMLEAAGGRAGALKMVPGGTYGGKTIFKVNKSSQTGRTTSIDIIFKNYDGFKGYRCADVKNSPYTLYRLNTERDEPGKYRDSTEESKAELQAVKECIKAGKKKSIPLINPTMESAQKLQDVFNRERAAAVLRNAGLTKPEKTGRPYFDSVVDTYFKLLTLKPITSTQSAYSSQSSGAYSQCETRAYCPDGTRKHEQYRGYTTEGCTFKVRIKKAGYEVPARVVVITDKPQKTLPLEIPEGVAA